MAESQISKYLNISSTPRTPEEKSKQLIQRLELMAKPPPSGNLIEFKVPRELKGGEKEPKKTTMLVEGKMTESKKDAIEAEARELYAQMKAERLRVEAGTPHEVSFVSTPHKEVLKFLPPFMRKIATELQQATILQRDKVDKTQNVIDQLMKYVVDQGIAREQRFGETIAPGSEMLNRAAFSTFILNDRERRRQELLERKILGHEKYTQDTLDDEVDAQYTFRQIDIKDFRASDFAKDEEGNSGADYTINKVAQKVNRNIAKINEILLTQGVDATIVPCRYGGDELGLGFMGIEDPALRNLIFGVVTGLNETGDPEQAFQNGVKSIEGYFNRGGEIKVEKVDLKAGLDEIHVPKDKSKRKIFWEQFGIGLILSDDEISDIEASRQNESGLQLALGPKEIPVIETKNEFVQYTKKLIKRHPELQDIALAMISYVDEMPEVMTEFPKFVQEIMYDRLLGEKVTGIQDCVDHMIRGDVKELYMFDMKGIKEFNDIQSLATGDQAIATLWNTIANSLGPDFENVMCFRRGSTFIVGARKGAELSPEARAKLDSLTTIVFQGNEFAIGYSHVDVNDKTFVRTKKEAVDGKTDVRVVIEDLIVSTHEAWNRTVIDNDLMKDPGILDEVEVAKGTKFNPREGLTLFFNGKRTVERMDRCIDVCQQMEDESVDSTLKKEGVKEVQYGVDEYKNLGATIKHKLFFEIFPHKLKDARIDREQHKIDQLIGDWKRLLVKHKIEQDLGQYGIQ